ncbi:TatD family deoxyribonuclease [Saccharobesus litoralis]|uniref:TatD family deoxyribonuclease n=1 Tax=Saccharobesus litoralis TaxID=2172099 RepID=A0A2S0VMW3_9ALTE|nr:TatD family hydrolase [Saccharobesus litoralis]AWB65509.1 TatD family deoxyribonuclease [Saccharobesus litoralis]
MNESLSFIDSHCHLDFDCFNDDRMSLLAKCQVADIRQFIIPAVQASQWHKLIELCQQVNECYFALGLHPVFIAQHQLQDLVELKKIIKQQIDNPNFVAIGEIGLDFSLADHSFELQTQVFTEQLKLAREIRKPVILHHRKSLDVMAKVIRQSGFNCGGVLHAFSGSYQQAKMFLDLGFKLGVGGTITYPRARKTREVISQVPLDCLLLETDSPDMPVSGKQGQRNTPLTLLDVFNTLTELRAEDSTHIQQQVLTNTQQTFNLPTLPRV